MGGNECKIQKQRILLSSSFSSQHTKNIITMSDFPSNLFILIIFFWPFEPFAKCESVDSITNSIILVPFIFHCDFLSRPLCVFDILQDCFQPPSLTALISFFILKRYVHLSVHTVCDSKAADLPY